MGVLKAPSPNTAKITATFGSNSFIPAATEVWWVSVYHVWVLATQYIAPVLVMAYCYAMMAITIWRNKDLVNAEVSLLISQNTNILLLHFLVGY